MTSWERDRPSAPIFGDITNGSAARHAGEPDPPAGPPLHALLIGIEHYPDSELYDDLEGCVGDVSAFERYLVEVLDVPPARIAKLTAPRPGGVETGSGGSPTCVNLVAALRELESSCRPGEHALVFYAGQGGRTPTAFPEIKGRAASDECLVPIDIADPSVPYLRDTEIDVWVRRMVSKRVFVTLVMDCCHSGGLRRARDPRVRSGRAPDRSPRPPASGLATPEEIAGASGRSGVEGGPDSRPGRPRAAWNGGVARPRRQIEIAPAARVASEGYALFAACRPDERAFEYPFEGGRPAGALTHFLLRALQRMGKEATYRQLHAAVVEGVHSRFRNQTPVFEGEVRAFPLGHRELPRSWGLEVLAVETVAEPAAATAIRLGAGRAQGVDAGARFDVYPLEAVRCGVECARPASAAVVEAAATHCRAVVAPDPPGPSAGDLHATGGRLAASSARPIRPGDRAVLVDPGPSAVRRKVRLSISADRAGADLLVRFERRLRETPSARLVPDDSGGTDFEVGLEADGTLSIRDASGSALPHLPRLGISDPEVTDRLWATLDHLARFEGVRRLENTDEASPLFRTLSLRWEAGEGGPPLGAVHPPEIETGREVRLVIDNLHYLPLNVAVLDLHPDWGIGQIYPRSGGSVLIDAGGSLWIPLRSSLPETLEAGTDVLQVVAATEPIDLRWVELRPVSEAVLEGEPRPTVRHSLRSSSDTALGGALRHLQAAFRNGGPTHMADRPRRRSAVVRTASTPGAGWTVARLELRIRRSSD